MRIRHRGSPVFSCSLFVPWLCLLLIISAAPSFALSSLKVGVYNIHGGVGTDGSYDLPRIARVLKAAAPEVIGLNEVNRRYIGDKQDQVIAAELGPGWTAVFGKTIDKPFPPSEYGNAIITKLPVVSSQSWLLSDYPDQERRGLLRVTVRKDEELVHVFCVHMGLNATMRQQHAREILNIMDTFTDGRRILVGDFNEQRTGTSVEIFAAELEDTWQKFGTGAPNTFSSTNPVRRIDFIWTDSSLSATDCYVPAHPETKLASDHLPVFANLLTPGSPQPVINEVSIRVNGLERLNISDAVPDDPDAYTRGSAVLATSGESALCEIIADNLSFGRFDTVYREDFSSAPPNGAPPYWAYLYSTEGKDYSGGTAVLNGEKIWRQRSEDYVKYHYAPAVYPGWKSYEVSARIKTVSTGGGAWRLNVYNYPVTNTAYETYKIEVRHDSGALPRLRIMKGGAQLASGVLADSGIDPYDWNVYSLQVTADPAGTNQQANRLTAYVNGRRIASVRDMVISATSAPYTMGSIVLATIGGTQGWCEIYADDIEVREWKQELAETFDTAAPGYSPDWQHLYTTPGAGVTTGIVAGRQGSGWRHRSDKYLKYHFAPDPYPDWQNTSFKADVRTVSFGGGKWRMNGYNYPATDTAYETYKLEVHHGGGQPDLRLMKGGTMLKETQFATMGASATEWQTYELNIHSFQPSPRILEKNGSSSIPNWLDFF